MKNSILSLLAFLVIFISFGCHGTVQSKAVTAIADAQTQTTAQATTLNQLGNTKGVKSDSQAQSLTDQAKSQNKQIAKDLGVAKPAAQADANKAASADNAVVVRLERTGIALFVLGIASLLAGILAPSALGTLAAYFRTGGIVVAGSGVSALYLAYHWTAFNRALDVVVIGGAIGGALWLVLHYVSASQITAVESWIVTKVKNLFSKSSPSAKTISPSQITVSTTQK